MAIDEKQGFRQDIEVIQEFRKALHDHAALMERVNGSTSNTQTIHVNAGGWGVLVALVMVAFLAGLNIAQVGKQQAMHADLNEVRRKQDRDDDYLMTLFRAMPEVKRIIDREMERDERNDKSRPKT